MNNKKIKIFSCILFIACFVLSKNIFAVRTTSFRAPKLTKISCTKYTPSFGSTKRSCFVKTPNVSVKPVKIACTKNAYTGIKKTSNVNTFKNAKRTTAPKKIYVKKSAYEGLGKRSDVTGLPKTKVVRGHLTRTCNGATYVNPYARSK